MMQKSQRNQKGAKTMPEEDAVVKISIKGAGPAAATADADQGAGLLVSRGESQLRNPVLEYGSEAEAPERRGEKDGVLKAKNDDFKTEGLRRAENSQFLDSPLLAVRHWT